MQYNGRNEEQPVYTVHKGVNRRSSCSIRTMAIVQLIIYPVHKERDTPASNNWEWLALTRHNDITITKMKRRRFPFLARIGQKADVLFKLGLVSTGQHCSAILI